MRNRDYLLERLQALHEDKQTGVLSLAQGENVVSVHFDNGLISAVSTNIPHYHLGRYLANAGVLDEAGIENLVSEARRRQMLLGQAAVRKALLDRRELHDLIQEQAVQVLAHALTNDYEIQSFGRPTSAFDQPAGIGLNHLLLQLARKSLKPFRPAPRELIVMKNGTSLSHLPWYPEELAVLSKLKSPRTLQELAAATGLDDARLHKILSVFDTLQLITLVDESTEATTAVIKRDGFPFESLVPEIPKSGLSDKLETLLDEASFVSEQFKSLKVRIAELAATRAVKVLTVSSPDVEAGKSLVSINLAASFSKDSGHKTIILDGDLRNPSIHRFVGASVEPGLLGYLQGDYLQPFCYLRRLERLFVMTAGGIAQNPVELLSLDKMKKLMEFLRAEFDTIILDSPPLAPISDAQVLTGLSDGLILVMRSGKTSYGSIERAFKGLDRSKLLGLVLNDVKPRLFNTQYDYRYYRYKYRSRYPYQKGRPKPGIRLKTYLEQ